MTARPSTYLWLKFWIGVVVDLGPTRLPKEYLDSRAQPEQQVNAAQEAPNPGGNDGPDREVHGVVIDRFNDPSAGSPTETLLRLLLPLGGRV